MRASKGLRSNARRKLSKKSGAKFTITPYLVDYQPNQRVVIKIDPTSQKGMPYVRFKGLQGIVKEKRGDAFVVEVMAGNKMKTVISRPEHLMAAK